MTELLQSSAVRGALSGWLAAALIDYRAFRRWRTFAEARAYDWQIAAWRWTQGAVTGALAALGMGAL